MISTMIVFFFFFGSQVVISFLLCCGSKLVSMMKNMYMTVCSFSLVLAFKLLPTVQCVQYSHVNITLTVCNIYSVYKAHIILVTLC